MEGRREGRDLGERKGPLGDLDRRLAAFSPSSSDVNVVQASVMWVHLVLTADRHSTVRAREGI